MAVVIDNASIHTSNEFTENIEEWAKKGLITHIERLTIPKIMI
jgi:hypothetical protein